MIDIQSLGLEDSKKVLKSLRLYKDLSKKLGRRGRKIFSDTTTGTHSYIVEYFPNVWKEYALEKALYVYEHTFEVIPKKEEVFLVEKNHLISGLKVYFDDNCVDLSFKNIENKLQK